MKKSILKELIHRRIPQIIGSYFIGATSLILFIDWLIEKYGFSDYYISLALFGLISIIPTVLILGYFHGAPGKDEWTRVEKYGIPINIVFIALSLFVGNRYNIWQDASPDHSKVYDSFLINIKSTQQYVDEYIQTDSYKDISSFVDSIYPLKFEKITEIQDYVHQKIRQEFINHDIKIIFPEEEDEKDMISSMYGWDYIDLLVSTGKRDDAVAQKKEMFKNNDYFNDKHSTNIDWVLNIDVYEVIPSKEAILSFDIKEYTNPRIFSFDYIGMNDYIKKNATKRSSSRVFQSNDSFEYIDRDIEESTMIKDLILDFLTRIIKDFTFGQNIGSVRDILDENLVTIKLTKPHLIRGTELICLDRKHTLRTGDDINKSLTSYINSRKTIYNYYKKHPEEIKELYDNLKWDYKNEDDADYIKVFKKDIDSLEQNYHNIIDEYNNRIGVMSSKLSTDEYRYYLKILSVQDSIATAKITGKVAPFTKPMIGDKINLK